MLQLWIKSQCCHCESSHNVTTVNQVTVLPLWIKSQCYHCESSHNVATVNQVTMLPLWINLQCCHCESTCSVATVTQLAVVPLWIKHAILSVHLLLHCIYYHFEHKIWSWQMTNRHTCMHSNKRIPQCILNRFTHLFYYLLSFEIHSHTLFCTRNIDIAYFRIHNRMWPNLKKNPHLQCFYFNIFYIFFRFQISLKSKT